MSHGDNASGDRRDLERRIRNFKRASLANNFRSERELKVIWEARDIEEMASRIADILRIYLTIPGYAAVGSIRIESPRDEDGDFIQVVVSTFGPPLDSVEIKAIKTIHLPGYELTFEPAEDERGLTVEIR